MKCAEYGNIEILKLLILMGADVNLKNEFGETALLLATKNNHKECVDILINAQSYINSNLNKQDSNDLIKEAEEKLYYFDIDILNFSLLSKNQIYGAKCLDIIKHYSTAAAISDYAILLGGTIIDGYTKDGPYLENRMGWWWMSSFDFEKVGVYSEIGTSTTFCDPHNRNIGCRPSINYSLIFNNCDMKTNINNGDEILLGEYPQTVVKECESVKLEEMFKSNYLRLTGKKYTYDSVDIADFDKAFEPANYLEYEYNGNKYVRIISDSKSEGKTLSDGRTVFSNYAYWIKVEPIVYLYDKESDILLSKNILFAGIRFAGKLIDEYKKYITDFNKTEIKYYLDNYFVKEIIPSKNYEIETEKVIKADSSKALIKQYVASLFK